MMLCYFCNGSGEGLNDGTTCFRCKGKGGWLEEVLYERHDDEPDYRDERTEEKFI